MTRIVGTLTLQSGLTATLLDDGSWQADDQDLHKFLTALYGPEEYPPTPAAGTSMYADQLRAAAERFGVEPAWAVGGAGTQQEGVVY